MYKLFKELGKKIVKVRIYEHVVLKIKLQVTTPSEYILQSLDLTPLNTHLKFKQ